MYNKLQIFNSLSENSVTLTSKHTKIDLSIPYIAKQFDILKVRAEEYMQTGSPPLTYSLFKLYLEKGDRITFEKNYFERRGRLLTFSLLSFVYQDNASYLKQLEEVIWDICDEPFWCLPAHFLGVNNVDLPFEKYENYLDLFASETGFALCECLELNKDRLSSNIVHQAKKQLNKRIINSFLNNENLFRFEMMANNWSSVCASAMGSVALYLIKDSEVLTNFLHRVFSSVDIYLNSFGDDGVCTEGVAYWTYGFGFLVCFGELLEQKTNGKLDIFKLDKVKAIALAQQYYYIHGNQTVSFADGSTTETFRVGISSYLQSKYKEACLPNLEYAKDAIDDGCYRFCLGVRDILWFDTNTRFGLSATSCVYLKDSEWFISRTPNIAVIAKSGNNFESHNHNDVGSFIYFKSGVPILCDLGAGLYDAKYFSDERYNIFVNTSLSHNVPIINGKPQQFGEKFKAINTSTKFSENIDSFQTSLNFVYADDMIADFTRKIVVDKEINQATIIDELILLEKGEVAENFVSLCPIEVKDNVAIIKNGGVIASLIFDSNLLSPSVVTEVFINHFNKEVTAYRLLLSTKQKANRFKISISLR